ncbi:extra-large guanine nucleotide-binding protein 3-like [Melia azedarach]|uniref:Extra-large guanine nucleotide-binding protein 3-like n=1 Tax=Melia azedarach TaxID=155640 RepID=A0ACC1Y7M8_MELAZ|nr:extra-large guanine nucleotide-binding protein 3-like [Melia azedarach]
MGDKSTLAQARRELEDLYMGIPDDSVNLTFEDLAEVKQTVNNINVPSEKKNLQPIINESPTPKHYSSELTKLPSLDFNRGLQETRNHTHHHHRHHVEDDRSRHQHRSHTNISPAERREEFRQAVQSSVAFDSVSVISMASMYQEKAHQRRRPGIPHSNICTVCSTYIYIFRHRCLVCGRVYCRDCVSVGMGEMNEGRKCIQCLGRRFSQRYIQRAGMVGCCSRYPTTVKQAELKWAEKGPRRSGERAYGGGRSTVMSRSRSPVPLTTPTRAAHGIGNATPSFVAGASSTYSPYTPNHYHLPL